MTAQRWPRWITTAAVVLLAINAATVSFAHMFELALRHGEPAWRAAQFPLSVDGMIVASSMALLNDARQGRRGGVLPWTLLVIGSVASLAANIAVADPTVWSRIIHAWPSFALIGSYELLMRQFRAGARGVRPEHARSTPRADTGATPPVAHQTSLAESRDIADGPEQRHLRVVGTDQPASPAECAEGAGTDRPSPPIQRDAWGWALRYQREHGTLPTGKEIARAHHRRDRWGRMVKQRGMQGRLGNDGAVGDSAMARSPLANEPRPTARAAP